MFVDANNTDPSGQCANSATTLLRSSDVNTASFILKTVRSWMKSNMDPAGLLVRSMLPLSVCWHMPTACGSCSSMASIAAAL